MGTRGIIRTFQCISIFLGVGLGGRWMFGKIQAEVVKQYEAQPQGGQLDNADIFMGAAQLVLNALTWLDW